MQYTKQESVFVTLNHFQQWLWWKQNSEPNCGGFCSIGIKTIQHGNRKSMTNDVPVERDFLASHVKLPDSICSWHCFTCPTWRYHTTQLAIAGISYFPPIISLYMLLKIRRKSTKSTSILSQVRKQSRRKLKEGGKFVAGESSTTLPGHWAPDTTSGGCVGWRLAWVRSREPLQTKMSKMFHGF